MLLIVLLMLGIWYMLGKSNSFQIQYIHTYIHTYIESMLNIASFQCYTCIHSYIHFVLRLSVLRLLHLPNFFLWLVYQFQLPKIVFPQFYKKHSYKQNCHFQRSSPSPVSDTSRAGFEPAESLSSGLAE